MTDHACADSSMGRHLGLDLDQQHEPAQAEPGDRNVFGGRAGWEAMLVGIYLAYDR